MIVRSPLVTYGVSLVAVAVALVLRLLLDPLLGDRLPFITLFIAVSFAAWYGGRGPAFAALVVGAVGAAGLILQPRYTFGVDQFEYQVGLVLYGIVGIVSIFLFESLRKATQRAEDTSDLLRTTLTSIGDAVITTDAGGRITNMNTIGQSLTGWSIEEASGQPLDAVFRIVNEQARQPVENPVTRALREGVSVGLANHTVLIAKDGTEKPIDDSAAPIKRNNGAIIGSVLVFRDVTARRRQERELEVREQEFRTLINNSPDLVVRLDCDLRHTFVSQAVVTIAGLQPEEMLGKTALETGMPEESWHAFRDCCREAARTGDFVTFEFTDDRTGSLKWLVSKIVPEAGPDGVVKSFLIMTTDITERKRAEELRRESEVRFRSLAEGMPHCVWVCDAQGFNEYQNQAWYAYTGRPPETDHGVDWLDRYHPEDQARLLEEWLTARRTEGAHPYDIEVRIRRWDGEYRWFRVMGSAIKDAGGAVVRWVGTCTDIHEQRLLLDALQGADRRKDEFLATLAHELRNPLAPVTNWLEVMKRANGNIALIEQARSTMERQIGQMVRLIDDLLDVSRITTNRLELKTQRIELSSVIHHVVEACRPDYEQAGHKLHVTLPSEPIYLHADPVRLAQVLGNLLTNSGKYTEPGGRIWLIVEGQGSDIVVKVKDTGIGIPSEMLPKVFDMFTQVDRSLNRSQGGLGIGLSLVKRLVEMHGGAVSAHSEGPGKGSEFVVRLPVVIETPKILPMPEPSRDPAATTAHRILIVDDNRDNAASLAMLLSINGNNTQTAHDGVEAVEKAAAIRPDVILLDLGLPKMSGYEACRAIRQHPWGEAITIVALTGWGQEEDRRKSKEAGFNDHLIKPVDPAALTTLLDSLPADRGATGN